MKTLVKTVLYSMSLVFFVVLACNKDDDELTKEGPFQISELAGSWEATSASFGGTNVSVDIIGEGGSVSMIVQSSGRFTLTIDSADRAAYTVSGEMFWEKWEGQFYFAIKWDKYPGDWDTYGATLTATTLRIIGGFDSAEYDFNNDGTFESASISVEFERV